MTVTLELPLETERLLRARAAHRGQDFQSYLVQELARIPEELPWDASPNGSSSQSEDDDDETPWRGVFVLSPNRKKLFEIEIGISPTDMPRWQPRLTLDPHRLEEEDE